MNLIKKVKNRLKSKKPSEGGTSKAVVYSGGFFQQRLKLGSRRGITFVVLFALSGAAILYLVFAAGIVSSVEQDQISRVNNLRSSKNVKTLAVSACMTEAAREWSQKMAVAQHLNHSSETIGTNNLTEKYCGPGWSILGENIGVGYSSADVYNALYGSATHYANMVDGRFNLIGVGVYQDESQAYWITQLFAKCDGCWGDTPVAPAPTPPPPTQKPSGVSSATSPDRKNWWVVEATGKVFAYAATGVTPQHYGDMDGRVNNIIGISATASGKGYWLLGQDGGIFAFGDAVFYGSMGGHALNAPIVAIAAHPSGKGYWLVGSDGGVYTFGDASVVKFWGSMGGKPLNKPIVGIASSASGNGYWLVAGDGGIFAFGDAKFFGSTGNIRLNAPIVSMTTTVDGQGYWMLAKDGGIFSFGNAVFYGSTGNTTITTPAVGFVVNVDNLGYFITEANGTRHGFGSAFGKGYVMENLPLPTYKTTMTWDPNFAPTGVPSGCVRIWEPADPNSWDNNILCAKPELGLSFNSSFSADDVVPQRCVRMNEPGDPNSWQDNVLCASSYVGLQWSYSGSLDDADTDCVNVNEPTDPYYWADNYVCWYVPPNYVNTPPSVPSNITASSITPSSIRINWAESTDNTAVENYRVYRGGALVATVGQGLSYNDQGLATDATFSYQISAVDYEGLESARSNPVSFSTSSAGLLGEYSGRNVQDNVVYKFSRIDSNIDFDWGSGSPHSSLAPDGFNVKWTGKITTPNTPTTQPYTFYTLSDDGVRLWVNDILIINNWTDHGLTENSGNIFLQASRSYNIRMEYYEAAGSSTAKLYWSNASAISTKEIVPTSRLSSVPVSNPTVVDTAAPSTPTGLTASLITSTQVNLTWSPSADTGGSSLAGYNVLRDGVKIATTSTPSFGDGTVQPGTNYTYTIKAYDGAGNRSSASSQLVVNVPVPGTGLSGNYFDNVDLTNPKFTRLDPKINFNWGGGSPSTALGSDTFSIRWKGQVQAPSTGSYTFYTNSNDGVRLWVDGRLIVDNWTNHAVTENSGTISLIAGQKYAIKLEYYENIIDSIIQLSWSGPSVPKATIPRSQLFPNQ